MFFIILAKILMMAGVAFLATIVVKVALLTLRSVLLKIREKLKVSAGGRVALASVSKLVKEITMEAERTGNIHKVDALLAELGEDGVVMASVDADNEVNPDEIEILSSGEMDDKLKDLLQKNHGEVVFA